MSVHLEDDMLYQFDPKHHSHCSGLEKSTQWFIVAFGEVENEGNIGLYVRDPICFMIMFGL